MYDRTLVVVEEDGNGHSLVELQYLEDDLYHEQRGIWDRASECTAHLIVVEARGDTGAVDNIFIFHHARRLVPLKLTHANDMGKGQGQ